jgi:hypothetical protein
MGGVAMAIEFPRPASECGNDLSALSVQSAVCAGSAGTQFQAAKYIVTEHLKNCSQK